MNENKYELNLKYHFDAAHKLDLTYDSPCKRLHGHRWEVRVKIVSEKLNENGMIVDFTDIKKIIDNFDHENLNDIVQFNPTAERIAEFLHMMIVAKIKQGKVWVTIYESPDASITYGHNKD